jgi:hypothetical protein
MGDDRRALVPAPGSSPHECAAPVYSVAVSARSPKKTLKQATDLLDDFYGRPVLSPRYPPVDEPVFTSAVFWLSTVNTSSSTGGYRGESMGRP